MSTRFLAGLLSGVVLAVLMGIYGLVRGRAMVAFLKVSDAAFVSLPDSTVYLIVLGMLSGIGLIFGVISAYICAWFGSRHTFTLLAFGLATLFSILGVISRTPLLGDKIVMNFLVGGGLGLLLPWLLPS